VKKADFFDKGEKQASITADNGSYNWNFQRLEFEHHVVIQTSEHAVLKTDKVFWAKNLRVLYCPSRTTITDNKGNAYRAEGALYFPDQKFTVMYRNVVLRRGGKQPVTITGEYVAYRENFESADIYGAEWAALIFVQHQYQISQFIPYEVPKFTIENAKIATKDNSLAAIQLHLDTETKKVSSQGGRGIATFSKGGTLSATVMDFYWELGYLFAKYQVEMQKGTMNATTDEATYVQKDNSLRLSGNVVIKDEKPEWFYTGDQIVPGSVTADNVDYGVNSGNLAAEGKVHIEQGKSWADASKIIYNASSKETALQNAHVKTEKAEIFGRSLHVKGDAGRGAGDLKMTMLTRDTSIAAREGIWQNEEEFLFDGDVTGKQDKYAFSGDLVGKKDGVLTIAMKKGSAGAARATQESLSVAARTIKMSDKDNTIALDQDARLEKKEFTLIADRADMDTDKKAGKATGHAAIVLTEGNLPESLGASGGKTTVKGEPIEFTYEPDTLNVKGDTDITQDDLKISGQDFTWAKEGGGKLTTVLIKSPESYLGEDKPSEIRGDSLEFTDEAVTVSGNTRLDEGDSVMTADQIVYAQDGTMTATGGIVFTKTTTDDNGETHEAKLNCDSLSGEKDSGKISFAGPITLTAGKFTVKGDSGFFLSNDKVLIITGTVGVDTELEAGSTHLDMDQFQFDMKTRKPRFIGVKGEIPVTASK
ncbi:MAG: LPS export ABC transporter periplasmic protein LptC, partial [bacterium]